MVGFFGFDTGQSDGKRRVQFPHRGIRKYLSTDAHDTFVLTKGFEDCIYAYPLDVWPSVQQEVEDMPVDDPDARHFRREFLHFATECQLDPQGRLVLPQPLAEHLGIREGAELVVKGNGNHVEVWGMHHWNSYLAERKAEGKYEERAARLFKEVRERKRASAEGGGHGARQ